MTKQMGTRGRGASRRILFKKLTFYADDFWPVPLAVGTTLSGGDVALQEAVDALVAHHRVDVIVGALPTNQEGVIHGRRGSAQHWGIKNTDRT